MGFELALVMCFSVIFSGGLGRGGSGAEAGGWAGVGCRNVMVFGVLVEVYHGNGVSQGAGRVVWGGGATGKGPGFIGLGKGRGIFWAGVNGCDS